MVLLCSTVFKMFHFIVNLLHGELQIHVTISFSVYSKGCLKYMYLSVLTMSLIVLLFWRQPLSFLPWSLEFSGQSGWPTTTVKMTMYRQGFLSWEIRLSKLHTLQIQFYLWSNPGMLKAHEICHVAEYRVIYTVNSIVLALTSSLQFPSCGRS